MYKIREYLNYNPENGMLTWKKAPNSKKKIGDIAGYTPKDSYARVRINSTLFFSHRIAWFLYYGKYPKEYIRHIDGNPANNRINNLSLGRKEYKDVKREDVDLQIEHVPYSDKWRLFYMKNDKKVTLRYYTSKSSAIRAQQKRK
jgi:hypothetical protein